jgi:hypothetical protein
VSHNLRDIGGVSQSHVKSLRTDRRQNVRSLANQRDTVLGKLRRLLDRKRKHMAPGLDMHTTKN